MKANSITDAITAFKATHPSQTPDIGLTDETELKLLIAEFKGLLDKDLIDDDRLDDLVHDIKEREASIATNSATDNDSQQYGLKSMEASAINNEGWSAQIAYLLDKLGAASLRLTFNEFAQERLEAGLR